MEFRKKPIVIEAYQYLGDALEAMDWSGQVSNGNGTYLTLVLGEGLKVHTLEGHMNVSINDWIICGVNGELYPCKPDIFEKTYEPAE